MSSRHIGMSEATYTPGRDGVLNGDMKKDRDEEAATYYDESDTSSVEVLTGVSKVEAAQAVW